MAKKAKTTRKTSNDYWINRALKREKESYLIGQELNKRLLEVYKGTSSEIRKLIADFYMKYADENGLTYDEAIKLINSEEYSEFKRSLEEYVEEYTSETDPKRAAMLKAKVDAMAYRSRITRLEAVNTQIECAIDKMYLESVNELNKGFETVFKNSFKGKLTDLIDRFGQSITFDEKLIDTKIVKDVVSYPWCGNHFSDRLWKNKENLIYNMRDILSRGLLQGTSLPQMAKEMADKTGQSYKAAYNLVETETTHFHEEANFRAYEAGGIEQYQFWSEHELSVCSTCAELDMKVFDVKDRKEGINAPPIHPRCRCVTVEYDPDEKEDYINSGLEPPEDRETWQQWYEREGKFQENKKKRVEKGQESGIIKVTEDEQRALNYYISSDSYKINEKLRSKLALDEDDKELIKNLDKALDKMPIYKGTVYRSIYVNDVNGFLDSYRENIGEARTFLAYTSTGVTVYDSNAPIQYVIKSKNGKDVRLFNEEEQEVLFKRETKFKVLKVEDNVIHMEEV